MANFVLNAEAREEAVFQGKINAKKFIEQTLYSEDSVSEGDITQYFAFENIESQTRQKIILIVNLAKKLHYKGIPERIVNRLKGAARLYEVKTATRMLAFQNLLQEFDKSGIDVLVFGNSALKLHYMKDISYPIMHIDVAIREEQFEKAQKYVLDSRLQRFNSNKQTCHYSYIGLHRVMLEECLASANMTEVWDSAIKTTYHNTSLSFYVPSPEIMIVSILCKAFKDTQLFQQCKKGAPVKWITDVTAIIKGYKIDFGFMAKISIENHLDLQMYVMLTILERIENGLITREQLDLFYPDKQQIDGRRQ